jgi:hypothetical protein
MGVMFTNLANELGHHLLPVVGWERNSLVDDDHPNSINQQVQTPLLAITQWCIRSPSIYAGTLPQFNIANMAMLRWNIVIYGDGP